MIIVEGPDGAGKSTLIQDLREEFGLPIGTRGTDDRDRLFEVTVPDTMRAIRVELMGPAQPAIIWDRLYFSDLIYAPVQGREVAFSRTERHIVEWFLKAAHIPVVFCYPPWEEVKKNVLDPDRHEMPAVKENIERIYHSYPFAMRRVPCIPYDYTKSDSYDYVCKWIDSYLQERSTRKWTAPNGSN